MYKLGNNNNILSSEILKNDKNYIIIKENYSNFTSLIKMYSYKSLIAIYDKDSKILNITNLWDYSQVTLKQFKDFINNYTCFEYKTKKNFEKIIDKNEIYYL